MADRNEKLTRAERYQRGGKDDFGETGAFDIDILNTLGRDQKAARNRLYQEALQKPEDYLKKRNEAIETLIDTEVRAFYVKFKKLLKYGEYTGGNLLYPGSSTDRYYPSLPDASVQKFCIGVAETIEDICEKAFEEIYPMDHKDLAVKRISDMSKSATATAGSSLGTV